jgi:hypothetical protein
MNSSDVSETIILSVAAICATMIIGGCMMQESSEKKTEQETTKAAMENGYEQVRQDGWSTPLWKKVSSPEPK